MTKESAAMLSLHGVRASRRHASCVSSDQYVRRVLSPGAMPSEMVRDRLTGGEMRYILAIFLGLLLIIFGVFGGLLDLIF